MITILLKSYKYNTSKIFLKQMNIDNNKCKCGFQIKLVYCWYIILLCTRKPLNIIENII